MPRKLLEKVLASVQVGGKKAKLNVGQEAFVPSLKEQSGVILDQIPKPGERIRIGSPIHLLVSTGKAEYGFRMANYTNQDIDLLYETFAIRNIEVLYKVQYVKDKQEHGRVLAQYPRKGTKIQKGDSVTFTVGIFDEDLFHRIGYEIVKYGVRKNLDGKNIEIYIKDNYPRRKRFQKKVKAGESLLAIIRRDGDASITIESENKIIDTIDIKENTKRN
jgi:beta-lactam-binding protein with PASTA domain